MTELARTVAAQLRMLAKAITDDIPHRYLKAERDAEIARLDQLAETFAGCHLLRRQDLQLAAQKLAVLRDLTPNVRYDRFPTRQAMCLACDEIDRLVRSLRHAPQAFIPSVSDQAA